MTPTALTLFAGAFAVIFAPPLSAQDAARATSALLGQGAASIEFAGSPPAEEPAADPGASALLGQRSGVRLRLEPDRPGRDPDPAVRGLLGR
ncbi:MAG: hypothetical protein ACREOF_12985 [Gemmatimonadales bacterium]